MAMKSGAIAVLGRVRCCAIIVFKPARHQHHDAGFRVYLDNALTNLKAKRA